MGADGRDPITFGVPFRQAQGNRVSSIVGGTVERGKAVAFVEEIGLKLEEVAGARGDEVDETGLIGLGAIGGGGLSAAVWVRVKATDHAGFSFAQFAQ